MKLLALLLKLWADTQMQTDPSANEDYTCPRECVTVETPGGLIITRCPVLETRICIWNICASCTSGGSSTTCKVSNKLTGKACEKSCWDERNYCTDWSCN